jgi:hypothetical protein
MKNSSTDQQNPINPNDKLGSDLKVIFKANKDVPPQMDERILVEAREHFNRRSALPRRRRVRVWFTASAAVAALVFIGLQIQLSMQPASKHTPETSPLALNQNVDQTDFLIDDEIAGDWPVESSPADKHMPVDGKVDTTIRIAEQIRYDVDQDGQVNILDALRLAQNVKRSKFVNMAWDFNGDALVDQRDIDTVAYAAVRLEKGVFQ